MSDESIFAKALAIPNPAKRADFLDQACAGKPDQRAELDALLAAHAAANPLDQPPADLAPTELPERDPQSASVGDQIGPYRVMEQIGEGGFGLVFVAEQQQPVRRKVALKVLKPGMDTRQVVARFEAERQALALMDHPHIARVFDAGSTDTGRPYFVMELIRGIPITEYCDQQKLSTPGRLELFTQVCEALQHAHQKGIIHRDLKPTNVLVAPHDGKPLVKVIDFGVAKALGQTLTDKTIYTQFTQMIGTPLYMSPEQAEVNQLDVDTRSDIYSLGVLLYELLTGTTPLDKDRLRTAAYEEIRRLIREEDPPKPSTRLSSLGDTLSTVSSNRGTEPARLTGIVRGELDWIVMKCLEKDRNRRYDSAAGLSKDVARYLQGEAVEACPPTLAYRFRKAYRRNRAAVMTTGVVVLALVLGSIISLQQAIRATRAEQRALQGEQDLQAAFRFLWGDVLSQFSPEGSPNGDLKVQTVMDHACAQLELDQEHSPGIEAMIRGMAGRVYTELGQYKKSNKQLERAIPELKRELGVDHLETLAAEEAFARSQMYGGTTESDLDEAVQLLTKVWETRCDVQGVGHPDTLRCLMRRLHLYYWMGDFEKDEEMARLAVKIAKREHGEEGVMTAEASICLANSLMQWEGESEAGELVERAHTVLEQKLGPDHPRTMEAALAKARLLFFQERYEEAAALEINNYERWKRVFGETHPRMARLVDGITLSHLLRKDYDAAQPWVEKLVELSPQASGWQHPLTARAFEFFGRYHLGKGQIDAAEEALNQALSIWDGIGVSQYGFYKVNLGTAKSALAECRMHREDWAAAERLLLESQDIFRSIPVHSSGKKHHWQYTFEPENLTRLVRLYEAIEQPVQAAKWRTELERYSP